MSNEKQMHTVLITGGGSGIGLALAGRFLEDGHTMIICGRDEAKLKAAQEQHPQLLIRQADVSRPEDQQALAAWLKSSAPAVNVLVNNAGIQQPMDFREATPSPADIAKEININLFGPIALTALLLPLLRGNHDPTIVNVTSGLAFCPLADVPVYCATKAAFHSFTLSLRHQLKEEVRVVEVAPPIVATNLDKAERRPQEGGPPVISAEDFAREVVDRFFNGDDEIVVGLANGLRQRGEAGFTDMNDR